VWSRSKAKRNLANNYYPVSYEVVRDHLRILLADGVPRWEYRYLNQLFPSRPSTLNSMNYCFSADDSRHRQPGR